MAHSFVQWKFQLVNCQKFLTSHLFSTPNKFGMLCCPDKFTDGFGRRCKNSADVFCPCYEAKVHRLQSLLVPKKPSAKCQEGAGSPRCFIRVTLVIGLGAWGHAAALGLAPQPAAATTSALGSKSLLQGMKDWHKLKLELLQNNPHKLPGRDNYSSSLGCLSGGDIIVMNMTFIGNSIIFKWYLNESYNTDLVRLGRDRESFLFANEN